MRYGAVIVFLASALCVMAGQMQNRNAYGVRGTDSRYFPPGYSQSKLWYKFDGTDTNNIIDYSSIRTNSGYVKITNGGGSFSLSNGVFKTNPNPTNAYVMSRYAPPANPNRQATWYAWVNVARTVSYQGIFMFRGGGNANGLFSDTVGWNNLTAINWYGNLFTTNAWHLLVGTHSNGTSTIYTDGAKATPAVFSSTANTPAIFYIGYDPNSAGQQLEGQVSEVYYTEYLFTHQDVSNVLNKGAQ